MKQQPTFISNTSGESFCIIAIISCVISSAIGYFSDVCSPAGKSTISQNVHFSQVSKMISVLHFRDKSVQTLNELNHFTRMNRLKWKCIENQDCVSIKLCGNQNWRFSININDQMTMVIEWIFFAPRWHYIKSHEPSMKTYRKREKKHLCIGKWNDDGESKREMCDFLSLISLRNRLIVTALRSN